MVAEITQDTDALSAVHLGETGQFFFETPTGG
jgi:hypothetical protein